MFVCPALEYRPWRRKQHKAIKTMNYCNYSLTSLSTDSTSWPWTIAIIHWHHWRLTPHQDEHSHKDWIEKAGTFTANEHICPCRCVVVQCCIIVHFDTHRITHHMFAMMTIAAVWLRIKSVIDEPESFAAFIQEFFSIIITIIFNIFTICLIEKWTWHRFTGLRWRIVSEIWRTPTMQSILA